MQSLSCGVRICFFGVEASLYASFRFRFLASRFSHEICLDMMDFIQELLA